MIHYYQNWSLTHSWGFCVNNLKVVRTASPLTVECTTRGDWKQMRPNESLLYYLKRITAPVNIRWWLQIMLTPPHVESHLEWERAVTAPTGSLVRLGVWRWEIASRWSERRTCCNKWLHSLTLVWCHFMLRIICCRLKKNGLFFFQAQEWSGCKHYTLHIFLTASLRQNSCVWQRPLLDWHLLCLSKRDWSVVFVWVTIGGGENSSNKHLIFDQSRLNRSHFQVNLFSWFGELLCG